MNVLALETATSACGVALMQDGLVLAELTLQRPRAHAENLVPMIRDALGYGGISPKEVDAVAVSSGPGSYTGLRIGVSTAKGLAMAVDASLVSVPSLQALATLVRTASTRDRIGAAIDARGTEAYAALFEVAPDHSIYPVRATAVVRPEGAMEWLAEPCERLWLIGDAWSKMTGVLDSEGLEYRLVGSVHPSASAVAAIGTERFAGGQVEDPVTFEPYYLKEFVASAPTATAFEKLPF